MELKLQGKIEAPRSSSRTAIRNDPQECDALRQADIALIHSAPTGEKYPAVRRRICACPSSRSQATHPSSGGEQGLWRDNQCPLCAFFIAASCSALAEP